MVVGESWILEAKVRFLPPRPNMEDDAAGMVLRLALKTRFSDKGMGFDSSVFRQQIAVDTK